MNIIQLLLSGGSTQVRYITTVTTVIAALAAAICFASTQGLMIVVIFALIFPFSSAHGHYLRPPCYAGCISLHTETLNREIPSRNWGEGLQKLRNPRKS